MGTPEIIKKSTIDHQWHDCFKKILKNDQEKQEKNTIYTSVSW